MTITQSSTPLARVTVERRPDGLSDVWLRKNIVETMTDDGPVWEAVELHFVSVDALTVEQAENQFAALWAEHDPNKLSDREYLDAFIMEASEALAELAEMMTEGME